MHKAMSSLTRMVSLNWRRPNPRVELPYTYLVAWYIMHCPSLMMAVHALKDFVPFCAEIGML